LNAHTLFVVDFIGILGSTAGGLGYLFCFRKKVELHEQDRFSDMGRFSLKCLVIHHVIR